MRSRDVRRLFSLLVILVALAVSAFVSTEDAVSPAEESRAEELQIATSPVVRVVDGDTIVVMINGEEEKVRIIGINAPESVDPRKGVQCFGKEASAHLKALLDGESVTLTADASQDDTDKYDRLLRYVDLPTMDVARQMILDGYAYEYTYNVPYKRQATYQEAMTEAREAGRGLWAEETCHGAL